MEEQLTHWCIDIKNWTDSGFQLVCVRILDNVDLGVLLRCRQELLDRQ
jgi:hypothetical protein